jgi:uncharacterized protein
MIARDIAGRLTARAAENPILVVTGPRQSGKTTLVRGVFSGRDYVNLEAPDVRMRAIEDPRGFLAEHPGGAILDEIQRAPELLSYLQIDADEHKQPGRWVLTGSQNFALTAHVSQSLAGRVARLELLPLSLTELRRTDGWSDDLFAMLWRGGYPAPLDRHADPGAWLADYTATYLERDVRQLLQVGDLLAFQAFLRLAAGRTAQLLNLSQLGADAGITHNTARSWIGVLEASYVVFRLPPFHRNIGRRLVKTPKLHFIDTGLACYLLGIRTPDELRLHPLRGAIFESWVVSEILKAHLNKGLTPRMSFFRDAQGLEVDLLVEHGNALTAVEAKSGATVPLEVFAPIAKAAATIPELETRIVVHGGRESFAATAGRALAWSDLDAADWIAEKASPAPRP